MTYQVDLRDIDFQLFEWLPIGEVLGAERFADWDEESLRMALREALKIAQNELDPANEFFDGANLGLAVSLLLSRGVGELESAPRRPGRSARSDGRGPGRGPCVRDGVGDRPERSMPPRPSPP
ncbi:MAG: hypothetical protein GY769_20345 [bacterium]|nr:hypothetical protein [bacterium]